MTWLATRGNILISQELIGMVPRRPSYETAKTHMSNPSASQYVNLEFIFRTASLCARDLFGLRFLSSLCSSQAQPIPDHGYMQVPVGCDPESATRSAVIFAFARIERPGNTTTAVPRGPMFIGPWRPRESRTRAQPQLFGLLLCPGLYIVGAHASTAVQY